MSEQQTHDDFADAARKIRAVSDQLGQVVVGQRQVILEVLSALLAGGHVLVEGVPGLGKTLLVRALAKAVKAKFARIQFTPDLMPSDVTGHAMYDMKSEQFKIRRGPVFCNFLLADEINRAPAKTQAALLEVMQEQQVTIEGKSLPVDTPFMVLATQNPIEQEGTYPLPEAQLDRFLLKVRIDYPDADEELQLVKQVTNGMVGEGLNVGGINPLLDPEQITQMQRAAAAVALDDRVYDYAVRIVRTTRDWAGIQAGAGPRATIALIRTARAYSLINGNTFVTPDAIKRMAKAVLRHRVSLSADMEIEGYRVDDVLDQLLGQVNAPRS